MPRLAAPKGTRADPARRLPPWMRRRLERDLLTRPTFDVIGDLALHTVCQEARCPNLHECFSRRTATFLVAGDQCTRSCRYCAVDFRRLPPPLDPEEPRRLAEAAARLRLAHVVVTGVARDDLPDGGAAHYAACVRVLRALPSRPSVEVLIPDFKADPAAVALVLDARPDVLNHNLETVRRLYPSIRPQGRYDWALAVLRQARAAGLPAKSGVMLGLGEEPSEIGAALRDLLDAGCSILTLGQYLRPSPLHAPVARFVPPAEFDAWRGEALSLGFREAFCGPFVRSSYHAGEVFERAVSV